MNLATDRTLLEVARAAHLAKSAARRPSAGCAGGRQEQSGCFASICRRARRWCSNPTFADPRDPRDRLGAEWDFLTYARSRGVAKRAGLPPGRDTGAA